MRIVQAAGWYFPDSIGGTELYVAALSERLRRAGHDVRVATPDPGAQRERTYQHADIPVYRYPTAAVVTRDQARGHATVPGAECFHEWLRAMRPDVVHFHTFVTGLALREVVAARATGARVVVTSHAASLGFLCERGTLMRDGVHLCDGAVSDQVCAECALTMRGVPATVARMLGRLPESVASSALANGTAIGTALAMRQLIAMNRRSQQELFEHIDAFVVLTDWAARALLGSGAPSQKVVMNRLGIRDGITSECRRASRNPAAPIVFGYVGRAEAVKGVEDAVRACTMLPLDANARLRVVTVAHGPQEQSVVARCRELAHHDPRVTMEGPVSPGDVGALLASIDVLLCPSRTVEGGPTVALEARAVGTPVIGTNLPALNEIVTHGDDGLLFDAGDVKALSDALGAVVANPALVDQWRTRLPRPRTYDSIAADYLTLYSRPAATRTVA